MPRLTTALSRARDKAKEIGKDIKFGFTGPTEGPQLSFRRDPETKKLSVQSVKQRRQNAPRLSLSQRLKQKAKQVKDDSSQQIRSSVRSDVERTKQFFEPKFIGTKESGKAKIRPRDFVREVGGIVKEEAQDAARFTGGLALGIGKKVTGLDDDVVPDRIDTGSSKMGRVLFGGRVAPTNVQATAEETVRFFSQDEELINRLSNTEQGFALPGLIAAGGVVMSIVPGGKKAAGKLAAKKLPKAFTAAWNKKTVQNTVKALDELAQTFSKEAVGPNSNREFRVATGKVDDLLKTSADDDVIDPNIVKQAEREFESLDVRPVIVDEQGRLLDGRHRLVGAKNKGVDEVPVIIQSDKGGFKKARTTRGKDGKFTGSEPAEFAGVEEGPTLRTLEELKGKRKVSKQFIADFVKQKDITQAERDVVMRTLEDMPPRVSAREFAEKVQTELVDLTDNTYLDDATEHFRVILNDDIRGPVRSYGERVYNSPIKNSAEDIHFSGRNNPGYFAHVRYEEVGKGANGLQDSGTRRILEIQSDLFQRGRLSEEARRRKANTQPSVFKSLVSKFEEQGLSPVDAAKRASEEVVGDLTNLQPYRNRWHERVIREEIKRAAKEGRQTLRFPTGETAMRVEGLSGAGDDIPWTVADNRPGHIDDPFANDGVLTQDRLKPGLRINSEGGDQWVVMELGPDGTFQAAPMSALSAFDIDTPESTVKAINNLTPAENKDLANVVETFSVSSELDKENPIFKFYEKDVQKYLKRIRPDFRVVTDEAGVTWYETTLRSMDSDQPVEAFGAVGGLEVDEEGNVTFDPTKAAIGIAGLSVAKRGSKKLKPKANQSIDGVKRNSKYAFNINKDRLVVDEVARKKLDDSVAAIKPELEQARGRKMSNQEVVEAAQMSEMARKIIPREQTKRLEAELLRARQAVAHAAGDPTLTPEYLESLRVVSSQAAHHGRMLQSFNISADAIEYGARERMLKDIFDLGHSVDEILEAAKGVDFNDARQASKFYREFVKPTWFEILNEYRYTNLLSSPLTHIVNAMSNAVQSGIMAPGTILANGAIDFVARGMTGRARTAYMQEFPAYYKGAFNSVGEALKRAGNSITGQQQITQLDVRHIPTGFAGGAFNIIPRILETGDVFFRTIIEGGMQEALLRRQMLDGSGINQVLIDKEAAEQAAYYVFRKELDISNKTGQGYLLTAIDNFTNAVASLRRNRFTDKVVSWYIPFIMTPTNILKQGIEYSPLGLATLPGNAKKQVQLGKTMIGSMVFAGAGYAAMKGDATWSAPRSEKEKEFFYASGRRPYALKVGNEWIPYTKLGPLAYPIAMAAAIKHYTQEAPTALTDTKTDMLVKVMSGWAQFFSDQSYMQGMGDLVDAISGDPRSFQNFKTNIPRQLIPLTSLLGWTARIVDPIFRDAGDSSWDRIKTGIPFLSRDVAPFLDPGGDPSKRQRPGINAIFPFTPNESRAEFEKLYQELLDQKRERHLRDEDRDEIRAQAADMYEIMRTLPPAEANNMLDTVSDEVYAEIKDLMEDKALTADDKILQGWGVTNGRRAEEIAKRLREIPDLEGRRAYLNDLKEKGIVSRNVEKQLDEIKDDQAIQQTQFHTRGFGAGDPQNQSRTAHRATLGDYDKGDVLHEDEFAGIYSYLAGKYQQGVAGGTIDPDGQQPPDFAEIPPDVLGPAFDEHRAGKSASDLEIEIATKNADPAEVENITAKIKEEHAKASEIVSTIWGDNVDLRAYFDVRRAMEKGVPMNEIIETQKEEFDEFLNELPGDTISQAPKLSPARVVQQVKDMMPAIFDSSFEKAVRNEAATRYPLSPEVVHNVLPNVEVRDVSGDPAFPAAGTHSIEKTQLVPETVRDFVFNKMPESIAARLPRSFYEGVGEPVSKVRLMDMGTSTIVHEMLHATFERTKFSDEGFNETWDQMKYQPGHEALLDIDKHIFSHPIYEPTVRQMKTAQSQGGKGYGPAGKHIAHERYAYLGEMAGKAGLSSIPGGVQQFYVGVFVDWEDKRGTRKGPRKIVPKSNRLLTTPTAGFQR